LRVGGKAILAILYVLKCKRGVGGRKALQQGERRTGDSDPVIKMRLFQIMSAEVTIKPATNNSMQVRINLIWLVLRKSLFLVTDRSEV